MNLFISIPVLVTAGIIRITAIGTAARQLRQDNRERIDCVGCQVGDDKTWDSTAFLEQQGSPNGGASQEAQETQGKHAHDDAYEQETLEEDRQERIVSEGSFSCSGSLFLLAVIVIPFFYVTSASSVDLAAHAWSILEVVAAVFIAILFYSAAHTLLRKSMHASILVDIVEALSYLLLLELALILASLGEDRKRNTIRMRSFGILFAHLYGFSMLELVSELTVRGMHGHKTWVAPAAVAGTYLFFVIILYTIEYVRFRLHVQETRVYTAAEQEMAHHSTHCEDVAAAMCLGFLIAQLLRFNLAGDPITGMVGEETDRVYMRAEITGLWIAVVVALLFAFLLGIVGYHQSYVTPASAGEVEAPSIISRAVHILDNTTSFTAGICSLYAIRWEVQAHLRMRKPDVVCYLVTLAIAAQIAFGFIAVMVFTAMVIRQVRRSIAAAHGTLGAEVDQDPVEAAASSQRWRDMMNHGIFNVIGALGVLFGFSMERVFEEALEDVAGAAGEEVAGTRSTAKCGNKCRSVKQLVTLGGAVLLSLAVLPALISTIVPTAIKKNEEASRASGLKGKAHTRASMFTDVALAGAEDESDEPESIPTEGRAGQRA